MSGSDTRSPRERLLGMAAGSKKMELLKARRLSVLGLVRSSFAPELVSVDGTMAWRAPQTPLCAEAEIFDAAYGDPSGGEYWAAWLDSREPDDVVARLLAAHLTIEALTARPKEFADDALVRHADVAGAPMFAELKEWAHRGRAQLFVARRDECRAALAGEPTGALRDRLGRLLENLNTRHLIPGSLRAAFSPATKQPDLDPKHPEGRDDALAATKTAMVGVNEASPRKRGRKPEQLPRVIGEMRAALAARKMTPSDLKDMLEKHLEKEFRASRDVCRKARVEVLSGNAGD